MDLFGAFLNPFKSGQNPLVSPKTDKSCYLQKSTCMYPRKNLSVKILVASLGSFSQAVAAHSNPELKNHRGFALNPCSNHFKLESSYLNH